MDFKQFLDQGIPRTEWNMRDRRIDHIIDIVPTRQPLSPEIRQLYSQPFDPPIHELILYFPKYYVDVAHNSIVERLVFDSDRGFSPFDIFGAIWTYYADPVTIYQIQGAANAFSERAADLLEQIQRGTRELDTIDRLSLLSEEPQELIALIEEGDGYFVEINDLY